MSTNIRIQRICKHCDLQFTAKTTVTKFCCHKCAQANYKLRAREEKIAESNTSTLKTIEIPIEKLKAKPFLNTTEACQLLGISRRTLYRMLERGELNAGKARTRTIIQRKDIEKIFEQPSSLISKQDSNHVPELELIPNDLSQYYNLKEVQIKYNISETALQNIIKRNGIQKVKMGWFAYVPKAIIDNLLK